ncbi:MAG: DUF4384 domain-containing protein [Acidobacteriia bacterium]|nr:DUF4384 domain-containing protein [Terriglobia bacterium]
MPVLFSGESYGFRLRERPLPTWLYIFEVDAPGNVAALFPNPAHGTDTNPLPPGQRTLIPNAGGWYRLGEAAGNMTIHAVLADRPCAVCERVLTLALRDAQGAALRAALANLLERAGEKTAEPQPLVLTLPFAHRKAPSP